MMIDSSATNLQDPNSMVDHGYVMHIPNLALEQMTAMDGYQDRKMISKQSMHSLRPKSSDKISESKMNNHKNYFKHLYQFITPERKSLNNNDQKIEQNNKLIKNHFDKLQKFNELKYLISKAEN